VALLGRLGRLNNEGGAHGAHYHVQGAWPIFKLILVSLLVGAA
jgi:hypothetical protein